MINTRCNTRRSGPVVSPQVATDRVTYNFESQASKLSLARLGIDALPESLLTTNRSSELGHIVVLDLKHNALQLLPSELFLCLTQLQEVDASEVMQ